MARRHYSDRDRAAALAVYDSMEGIENRTSVAAEQVGVPRQTLQRWLSSRDTAAPPDLRHEQKEALADVFERVARKALGYAERFYDVGAEPEGKLLQPSVTSAAIATDKAELLRGRATSRVEVDDKRDPEVVAGRVAEILDLAKFRKAKAKTG